MSEKLYKASDVIDILLDELSHMDYLKVIQRLAQVPSAVVRCEGCEHWDTNGYELQFDNDGLGWCEKIGEFDTNKDWFCGWGERRTKCD